MDGQAHKHSRARQTWRSVEEQVKIERPSSKSTLTVAVRWLGRWLKYRLRPKHPLPQHTGPNRGIFSITKEPPTRVAVLGDWGSGEPPARRVADEVTRLAPDVTIHLGDIYHVGSRREVNHNCLSSDANGARWPTATGSFAVPGNHEYMSGGKGFFERFVPHLGLTTPDGGWLAQETSYFCIDVDPWRLIGLDTGRRSVHYAGVELVVRLLSRLSWADRWKTWLPRPIIAWLSDVVALGTDDTRGLVLLSHHQFCTALDRRGDYSRPGHQIGKLLVRPRRVVWLWGHEHRFAVYEGQASGGASARRLTVFGRAVGNSGVEPDPVEDLGPFKDRIEQKRLTYADNREVRPGSNVGYNGFAMLTITGRTLTIDHHAVGETTSASDVILSEQFVLDDHGDVSEPSVTYALTDPMFITPATLSQHLDPSG